MPTATSFSWSFPWEQVVGGFNQFIGMMNTPVALAVALILVFIVAGFVVSIIRNQHPELTVTASGDYLSSRDGDEYVLHELDGEEIGRWTPDSVWEQDEDGHVEAEDEAYYLFKHGDAPGSMEANERDDRWVW